jgi:hypothetical protein
MTLAEQTSKELSDIEKDQRDDAVRPELRPLRLPDWWLPPHRNLLCQI